MEKPSGLGISRDCFRSWCGHLEMTGVLAMKIKPSVSEEKPFMGKKRELAKLWKTEVGKNLEGGWVMGKGPHLILKNCFTKTTPPFLFISKELSCSFLFTQTSALMYKLVF